MPAARQASRSSVEGIGGQRDDRRARVRRPRPRGCAASPRCRRSPACARPSARCHRARRLARADSQASTAASPLVATVGRCPSLRQQRARQQRVDLVVLRDQDREALAMHPRSSRRARHRRVVAGPFEFAVVARHPGGERRGAHRLDQIAGEAGLLQRRQLGAGGRRHQHEAARHRRASRGQARRRRRGRSRGRRTPRPRRAPAAAPAATLCVGRDANARAPVRQSACQQRAFDREAATIITSMPPSSGGANDASSRSAAAAQRQRDAEGRRRSRARSRPRCGRPCARRCAGRSTSPSPVPPNLRAIPPSACSNSLKMRSCSSGAMPMPVSRTRMSISPGQIAGLDDDRDAAAVGELHRIAGEIEQHLPQPRGVADHRAAAGRRRHRRRSRAPSPARAARSARPSPRPARRGRMRAHRGRCGRPRSWRSRGSRRSATAARRRRSSPP